MKAISKTAVLLLLCGNCYTAVAQSDTVQKITPQFKLSLNYNTGLNYFGRTDSLKSSGFFHWLNYG